MGNEKPEVSDAKKVELLEKIVKDLCLEMDRKNEEIQRLRRDLAVFELEPILPETPRPELFIDEMDKQEDGHDDGSYTRSFAVFKKYLEQF